MDYSKYKELKVTKENRILTITINRPDDWSICLKFDSSDTFQSGFDKSTSKCKALSKLILDLERLMIEKPFS